MNASASRTWQGGSPNAAWSVFAPFLLLIGGLATAVAAVAGNGNFVIVLAPVIVVGGMCVVWFAPIRYTLFGVLFLSLALDATDEGPWNSPLAPLGKLLAINLNKSVPISALALPGVVMIMLLLLTLYWHRRLIGSEIDGPGARQTAAPLFRGMLASFAAILVLVGFGAMHGGDTQMAKIQVQSFVYTLLFAYLLAISMRGMRDYRTIGTIIVATACIKSVYAMYVVSAMTPVADMNGAYATTHGDSMLFATATILLVVRLAEHPIRRHMVSCLVLLPLLLLGMQANNRRLVWVEIAIALFAFWMMSKRTKFKRIVATGLLLSIPLQVVYVAVGWNSNKKIFAPVKTFRSIGDSNVDNSTLYRDLENFNLMQMMKSSPLLGTGFGHPFVEVVRLPDISFFKEYKYMPHNSVLGLWAFTGALGFTGLSVVLVIGVYFAGRSYTAARTWEERVAAFMSIAAIVVFAIQCWGDIGFSERKAIFLVGPALAIAGQLAIRTGAWSTKPAAAAAKAAS